MIVLWLFCMQARQVITIIIIEDHILFAYFIVCFSICLDVCYLSVMSCGHYGDTIPIFFMVCSY